MKRSTQVLALSTIALALASLFAYANRNDLNRIERLERHSADRPASDAQRRLSSKPRKGTVGVAAVTDADVGDVASFGRNLHWLGVADMAVELTDTCPIVGGDPDAGCQALNPAPAITTFAFEDLGHISLPAKATNSLLCYWFSPVLNVTYYNPTATPAIARLRYSPTLTVENPVLDDPAMIDPMTGLPFGGRLLTSMTSSEVFEVPLDPEMQLFERSRDSTVCIAGFISHEALVGTYGLTEAQATEFFKQPTTVRMNISGSAQYVQGASLYFGFRIIGD
ncbi:MAG TPA: hypothetical protein VGD21_11015 [Lysobacter sp.]